MFSGFFFETHQKLPLVEDSCGNSGAQNSACFCVGIAPVDQEDSVFMLLVLPAFQVTFGTLHAHCGSELNSSSDNGPYQKPTTLKLIHFFNATNSQFYCGRSAQHTRFQYESMFRTFVCLFFTLNYDIIIHVV